MPNRAASPFCAARAAISRPAATPDTGVRRVPNGGSTAPAPAPKPAVPPATAAQPIGEGTGIIPPPAPSETAQALGGSAKPLTPAEAASLAAALKAVDESRWADARAAVANFRNTLLDRYVDWSILRVAPKTEAGLRQHLALPAREPRLARARGAAPPGRGPHRSGDAAVRSLPLLHGLPAAHQHRPHAPHGGGPGGEPQRPQEVRERQLAQRHLPQRRRERVPEPLRPSAERRRPDRPLRPPDARRQGAGRARACGQAAARLPAARQCAAGDGDEAPPMR